MTTCHVPWGLDLPVLFVLVADPGTGVRLRLDGATSIKRLYRSYALRL